MSDTVIVIGEIILGIAFLGVGSAIVTYVAARLMSKPAAAEETLATRYAKGEIGREQYLQMRDDLVGSPKESSRIGDSLVGAGKR